MTTIRFFSWYYSLLDLFSHFVKPVEKHSVETFRKAFRKAFAKPSVQALSLLQY